MAIDRTESDRSQQASGNLKEANAQGRYEISKDDLPLHCPTDDMTLWNSHPRVYIPMDTGDGKCPYCGTEYVLKGA